MDRVEPPRLTPARQTFYNAEQLARDYGMTVRWVQEICKDCPTPGQITLDDLWTGETG